MKDQVKNLERSLENLRDIRSLMVKFFGDHPEFNEVLWHVDSAIDDMKRSVHAAKTLSKYKSPVHPGQLKLL